MEQIFKTNCNVQPLHGRSIVRGTIYLKAQQLQSKNVSDKTYFKSFHLEGSAAPSLADHIGKEILIDKKLQAELHLYKYDKVFNPRDADLLKELLDNTPGKIVNELIKNGIEIETWIYLLLWDNDIVGIVDKDWKYESNGKSLIPELDELTKTIEVKPGEDEPNLIDVDFKGKKVQENIIPMINQPERRDAGTSITLDITMPKPKPKR